MMARTNTTLRFLILSVGALLVVMGFNAAADAGALLHDIACPDHGWFA